MPALIPTDRTAIVTWLGRVPTDGADLSARPVEEMPLSFAGLEGERHGGVTRPSCSRVTALYPKGTEIRNVRQMSILSAEEMAGIAETMGLDTLDPGWLGASMVVEGIPDFTHLPPSSRLQGPDGVTLTIDMQNQPCVLPGRVIEKDRPGHGAAFKGAAEGRRGVTAWVEREGTLRLGDRLTLFIPEQRAWAP